MSKKREEQVFSFLDVATALVQAAGIREGYWRLSFTFAPVIATNVNVGQVRAKEPIMMPASIVPVQRVSLLRVEQLDALSVDAAVVNPPKRLIDLPDLVTTH